MRKLIFCGLFSFGMAGCIPREATAPPEESRRASSPANVRDSDDPRQFESRLLEIAQSYQIYPQADPTLRLTRTACTDASARARAGRYLYFVFVEHPAEAVQPVGQAVVKEAWAAEEVPDDGTSLQDTTRKFKVPTARGDEELEQSFQPYVRDDGRLYHAREKAALLIMFKTDPQTPGTDHGWVYGTASADGKQVRSAGRLESCMKCHEKAANDRVFGLPGR